MGRAHFAHLPTLPISPIFSEFNPAQKNHAAHFAHIAQIAQFLICQVLFNVADLRATNYHLTILFKHNCPSDLFLSSILALRADPF
jgi:hypothetical protein